MTKKLRVKDTYTLQDPNEINSQIDELEEKVDSAIAAILYNNPKAVINTKVINEYLATHKERKMFPLPLRQINFFLQIFVLIIFKKKKNCISKI